MARNWRSYLNKSLFFKLTYVLLIILVISAYFDKRNAESIFNSLLGKNKDADETESKLLSFIIEKNVYSDVKTNLKVLNKNLENSIDNLQKYLNITKNLVIESDKNTAKFFDLTTPLEPAELYNQIACRKSKKVVVVTTLCVHDTFKDIHVSGSIWNNGVWEYHIILSFMEYISKNPDWLVLDIGAQIGQYSLLPAQLGRKVVTVEPFYDNIIRLHKAAKTEDIGDRITLIANAISNKRGEIKMLQPNSDNIGGQSLVENKHRVFNKNDIGKDDPKAKYYVETILFDDIVPYLPLTNDGKKFEKAIMKIDIEGFEPYAFQHANKLFDTLDIPLIMMEWGNLPKYSDMEKDVEQMLDFLYKRGYAAYNNGQVLNRVSWKFGWSWDILWKKAGY